MKDVIVNGIISSNEFIKPQRDYIYEKWIIFSIIRILKHFLSILQKKKKMQIPLKSYSPYILNFDDNLQFFGEI